MTVLHATPYDISACGFYFESYEEFKAKEAVAVNDYGQKVEEFEIQFIDGDDFELFEAVGIHQGNVSEWFDTYEEMDDETKFKLIYLLNHVYPRDVEQCMNVIDDLNLTEQTPEQWAEQYVDDSGMFENVPESLRYYFDFQAYARDSEINGFFNHVVIDGRDYIAEGV